MKRTDESLTLIERVLANIEISDLETAKNAINAGIINRVGM